ncbi:MAG TPA: hypothetical protein VE978_19775 [Chitinophagales bacterium]|nr:hypothetical protein [Chitinophagales bacterium]
MVSEKDANLAREQHSEKLQKQGAHAIAVDEINHKGEKTFGVIAFAEKQLQNMPEYLTIKKGKKTLNVPLKVQIAEKFKAE